MFVIMNFWGYEFDPEFEDGNSPYMFEKQQQKNNKYNMLTAKEQFHRTEDLQKSDIFVQLFCEVENLKYLTLVQAIKTLNLNRTSRNKWTQWLLKFTMLLSAKVQKLWTVSHEDLSNNGLFF